MQEISWTFTDTRYNDTAVTFDLVDQRIGNDVLVPTLGGSIVKLGTARIVLPVGVFHVGSLYVLRLRCDNVDAYSKQFTIAAQGMTTSGVWGDVEALIQSAGGAARVVGETAGVATGSPASAVTKASGALKVGLSVYWVLGSAMVMQTMAFSGWL
ncbi:hypothetical protein BC829DRAFT_395807 [Chytridium lagenaria]|nr:hypothetical protein BC829DRAFT_395807 [Chytridium lagenaria]